MNFSPDTYQNAEPTQPEELRRKIMRASWLSGALWLLSGSLLIAFFQPGAWSELLAGHRSWELQLLAGLTGGAAAGSLARIMMRLSAFRNISREYSIIQLIRQADLRRRDIVSISFSAGITEEWLFRAALQPVLGLWLSSLIFVGLHGYFKFKNPAQIFFGAFMMTLSLFLGLLFMHAGLIAAMLAHAVYDIIVTSSMRKPDE